ncbi:transposase [Pseudoalteromonas sp. MMG024]|uniref:transposase n=1 Tax=Pseudoalteromonas sp. MMG024 TaxID=2909980 RepID=UPI001F30479F|nr:transposase [Pseudoalteromonas sp. MMG024]MCF6459388.1 transposase [Pseudoalteromonas sp. MMG024]
MAVPRRNQVSLVDTPFYHCISRCVRRAFLCGEDKVTGKSYEHRRAWVEEKLLQLTKVFCIDICAYAVMSNHTHIVLHVDERKARRLTQKAVIIRWHKLFKGNLLTQKYLRGGKLDPAQLITLNDMTNAFRKRLMDISWFMRVLNEYIARKANFEDNCTGRFWEGRFKSQALLDEAALAACMAYVDLNPIRAKIANTPEQSDYTSIQQRIKAALNGEQPKPLMMFIGNPRKHIPKGLPFELKSYLELVELTGRIMREDKRGVIPHDTQPLLNRLSISPENWLKLTSKFTKSFHGAVGKPEHMAEYCEHLHKKRRPNVSNARALLA